MSWTLNEFLVRCARMADESDEGTNPPPRKRTSTWVHFVSGGYAPRLLHVTYASVINVISSFRSLRSGFYVAASSSPLPSRLSSSFRLRLIGGCFAATATCPLDVVKTRMQALHKVELTGSSQTRAPWGTQTFSALRFIYNKEGVRGLWRGIGPNLIGIIPSRAVYFATYAKAKEVLGQGKEEHAGVHIGAAVAAGVTVNTVTNPIWVIKTRLQLQSSAAGVPYTGALDCIRKMWQQEGIRGFYKGLMASYLGISETAIQFAIYERLKATLQQQHSSAKAGQMHYRDVQLSGQEYFVMASCAKFVASAITYPHEVIRTRLRERGSANKYKGVLSGLALIAREEGVMGLYGGAAAHILRVVPNAAIMFLTVEAITNYYARHANS